LIVTAQSVPINAPHFVAQHQMTNQNHLDPSTLDSGALEAHPSFASTLANGLAVLGCYSAGELWLSNKDIALRLGLTKPTVSRLAFTLIGLGYLRRDKLTGKYQLGPAVLSLGYPLLSQLTIRQIAADDMIELAKYARGPISVGVRDRLQVVYVETSQGKETNATRPGIGSTRPLLRTAMGRALLYAHPVEERRILEQRLSQAVPEEWKDYGPMLPAAYAEIAAKGFCSVAGDWRPTLAAVAVPLRHPVSGLRLAVNLTVPSYATNPEQLDQDLGPRLVELVRRMEQRMGH
jgi:DNA-binding IclR family transcriptional regulator